MEEKINNINAENTEPEKKTVICSSCGEEIADGFLFCPKCGKKAQEEEIAVTATVSESPRKGGHKVGKKQIIIIAVVLIILTVFGVMMSSVVKNNKLIKSFDGYVSSADYSTAVKYLSRNSENATFIKKAEKNVVKLYNNCINEGDYKKAADIFNGVISETYHISFETTEEIVEEALKDIETLQEEFVEEKKTLEEIKSVLESYKLFDEERINTKASEALENAEKMDDSRIGYAEGNTYYNNKDYGNAIKSYLKVIEIDKNYDDAQKKITELKDVYKKEVFGGLDSLLTAHKYEEALEKLNTLKSVCDDTEVDAKINTVNKAQETYQKEEAKKSQIIAVTNVKVYKANRYSDGMAAEVVIKNNSNKVVKNANIVIASYDSNGYAVNIEYPTLYGAEYDHMLRGSMSTINLLPGESYGRNRYYDDLNSRAAKGHAIVKKVEFADGTTWENPYYDYWVEDCKDTY